MKIFHYVTYIKTTLAMVAALLIVQAIADLALPAYTAKLVDVGIAQYGMEYAIPEILSEKTYEACRNNLDGTNRVLLENAYTAQEDGTYIKNTLSPEHTKELDTVLVQVLAHLAQSYDFSENSNASLDTSD
ncbi:MAG: hypothetical protein IJV62_02055, partial [Eggerthellaceae bacterium]|nr:hypothetical protein [Eggerthellaceae bacterium]